LGLDAPRFLVSHKETDQQIARCAVNLIIESLAVTSEDIVCSSVPGHALRFGTTIESQLKTGIQEGKALFALLTQDSIMSSWVLYELGAAWGLDRLIIPILGPGVAYKDLPGSLAQYPCISVDEPDVRVRSRIEEALNQLATSLSIERRKGGRQVAAVQDLITALIEWKPVDKPGSRMQELFPDGYAIHKTESGYSILRSIAEPFHYLCPTCYSKESRKELLQGDFDHSTILICYGCKSRYRVRPDAMQNNFRSRGALGVTNW
jgi:hypothetical protein